MQNDLKILLAEKQLRLADLARMMEVDKSAVTRWAAGKIPAHRALAVSKVTKIPLAKLRPDLWGVR